MTNPNRTPPDQLEQAIDGIVAQIIRWKRNSAASGQDGGRNGKVARAELAMTTGTVQVGEPVPDNGVVASPGRATAGRDAAKAAPA